MAFSKYTLLPSLRYPENKNDRENIIIHPRAWRRLEKYPKIGILEFHRHLIEDLETLISQRPEMYAKLPRFIDKHDSFLDPMSDETQTDVNQNTRHSMVASTKLNEPNYDDIFFSYASANDHKSFIEAIQWNRVDDARKYLSTVFHGYSYFWEYCMTCQYPYDDAPELHLFVPVMYVEWCYRAEMFRLFMERMLDPTQVIFTSLYEKHTPLPNGQIIVTGSTICKFMKRTIVEYLWTMNLSVENFNHFGEILKDKLLKSNIMFREYSFLDVDGYVEDNLLNVRFPPDIQSALYFARELYLCMPITRIWFPFKASSEIIQHFHTVPQESKLRMKWIWALCILLNSSYSVILYLLHVQALGFNHLCNWKNLELHRELCGLHEHIQPDDWHIRDNYYSTYPGIIDSGKGFTETEQLQNIANRLNEHFYTQDLDRQNYFCHYQSVYVYRAIACQIDNLFSILHTDAQINIACQTNNLFSILRNDAQINTVWYYCRRLPLELQAEILSVYTYCLSRLIPASAWRELFFLFTSKADSIDAPALTLKIQPAIDG